MKILYVDMQYDYGQKSRGLNQIGQIGFLQVFKTLGHEVSEFYYDEYLNQGRAELQEKLLSFADSVKPDLIFFCLYTDQFTKDTLLKLKSRYKTMNWFGDDQWRFDSFTRHYAPCFTYSITTDPFSVGRYRDLGVSNVILSQWAALNVDYGVDRVEYKYDLTFVGGAQPVRKWIVSEFAKKGLNVHCFGHGWPNGPVSLERMVQIFKESKINLNLTNSTNLDLRYLTHHWRNVVTAIRSPKTESQMKARNFEIPYYGGFQLADYVPFIEKYYHVGREVVCYSQVNEAISLSRYYLENDTEREALKKEAIARARNEHTYRHRFSEIFQQI